MQTIFVKVTASRTGGQIKTIKREVVGYSQEDADRRLDRLAGILAELVMAQVIEAKKEVAASGER